MKLLYPPDFQRLFRWNVYQRTRLIESILIGIPIPPIFVAENKDGVWEVVDGLQRLSTILSFIGLLKPNPNGSPNDNNNWIMDEGDLIKEFEGLIYSNLPLKLQLNIKRASCRVEIIKWNSDFDMRYELFNRLNTGGSELTDQEIRNCIFRGVSQDFNQFLKEVSQNVDFITLIQPTENQLQKLYLDELVLRFCSMIDTTETISDNLSIHMTNYMKEHVNNVNTNKIEELKKLFNRVINILKPLGSTIFRGRNSIFSPSIYDCVMVGVASYIDDYEKINDSKRIIEIKDNLIATKDFSDATGNYTTSKARINKRITLAKEKFQIV